MFPFKIIFIVFIIISRNHFTINEYKKAEFWKIWPHYNYANHHCGTEAEYLTCMQQSQVQSPARWIGVNLAPMNFGSYWFVAVILVYKAKNACVTWHADHTSPLNWQDCLSPLCAEKWKWGQQSVGRLRSSMVYTA